VAKMKKIKVEKGISKEQLQKMDIDHWPVWTKEISEFPWTYQEEEKCYILEGWVEVTTKDGEKITLTKGDFVTFPKGLSCTWKIKENIKKHYHFY
jgi:uncharacterized cupin superfamily protein